MDGRGPSDAAGYLATMVVALDRVATRCTLRSDIGQQILSHTVNSFLDAYESSQQKVLPIVDSFRRSDVVQHAGVSGSSYHSIVLQLADARYRTIAMRIECEAYFTGNLPKLSAEKVLADWDVVAADLADLIAGGEPVDDGFLAAGIETERHPPTFKKQSDVFWHWHLSYDMQPAACAKKWQAMTPAERERICPAEPGRLPSDHASARNRIKQQFDRKRKRNRK